ncbi:CidA/LrgA family protein [Gudongella oleilytica]|jgi:holin-like protein|uniref:CidA/LrgA family protein n=1 Tax=Gudongella oleilytica TaxID=1582259 RepID=UPI000FF88609|nr:CidA/LrgA family protein [Gudongella oleilytica]MDY0257051.1 CidA/LrgA family protein [Gudongella oleilytica]HMM69404.1 CidA/LrgA family protein [Gudongella oleilytica]
MTELKQLGIILLLLWIGQTVQGIFGLALPGNVLGMLLLLILLVTGLLKLKHVERVTEVLLGHLSFLFVPSIVGVMTVAYLFKGNVIKIFIIVFFSIIVVMVTSGRTVQWMLQRKNRKRGDQL